MNDSSPAVDPETSAAPESVDPQAPAADSPASGTDAGPAEVVPETGMRPGDPVRPSRDPMHGLREQDDAGRPDPLRRDRLRGGRAAAGVA